MPYAIRKSGNKYITYNKDTGQTKGTHPSKAKADAQANLLRAVKHGWKPTGKPSRAELKVMKHRAKKKL